MSISNKLLSLVSAITALCLIALPAHAQATRTWISGVGSDANPCSLTAPCKTFASAISKTAVNGEINCLDPNAAGTVTITKSITIDCTEIFVSILNTATNGIIINFDAFAVGDTRKLVRIRNINLNGGITGLNGIRIIGGAASAGSAVFIEDCLIDNEFGAPGRGVSDERTGGGELSISHTTVRDMAGTGIAILSTVQATLDNVHVQNANIGVGVANGARVMIANSVFSGNTAAGIADDAGAQVNIDNSVTSSNGTGIQSNGTTRIANTDISFNTTGISGATSSFVNNRISGNTAAGTAPTNIGAASSAFGQQ